MREARGVYYTPEPVVGYIVRSVDTLLKRAFKLKEGLAHAGKIKLVRAGAKGRETLETHRVQILDPATGTGTFLYAVIGKIREHFDGNAGAWPGYVADHLLPRLFGFELLMAPYAVAHMKLGIELEQSGYDFASDQRLGVFLTNSLEEAHEFTGLPLFTQWLAEESRAAANVKRDAPVMVVLGNPPYSGHSANTGAWIAHLLRGEDTLNHRKTENYFECDGAPLGERNPKWLNDDYVKFIRFAQWRIAQTGHGVLAFVTNHGYLDNPTFRGMRESLLKSFDAIYLLDLHGNSKKKERAPDGGKDENVFDIQQGVAIGIFVKHHANPPLPLAGEGRDEGGKPARVFHADLFGTRALKYATLDAQSVEDTVWTELAPASPSYYFVPENGNLREEYERGWKITEVMSVNSVGIVTARDALTIAYTAEEISARIKRFVSMPAEEARAEFGLGKDARDWKVAMAQLDLIEYGLNNATAPISYRPFDQRVTFYTGNTRGFHCMPRPEVMSHLTGQALGLMVSRQCNAQDWRNVHAFSGIVDHCLVSNITSEIGSAFPLWLYPRAATDLLDTAPREKTANLAPDFVAGLTKAAGRTPSPEDTLAYIYAILYAPSYRARYADFLKRDFPRVPLTSNRTLFDALVKAGHELIALHTMQTILRRITRYDVTGSNEVVKVRWAPTANGVMGRVYINAEQYFDGVPERVWDTHIGSYRVAEKWLKDRKGRQLSYDDLTHYQNVIAALARTLELQAKIDTAIQHSGGCPLAAPV
jgi:predicted helicase